MIITISVTDMIGLGIIALMLVALLIQYVYCCIDEWRQKRKNKK